MCVCVCMCVCACVRVCECVCMCKLVDSCLIGNQRYDFRSPNISILELKLSFFPSAVRTWNFLDSSIKNCKISHRILDEINKPF